MKEDGYKYSNERMLTYMIPAGIEKVANQDYFELKLGNIEEIEEIQNQLIKRNSSFMLDTNLIKTGLNQIITTVVTKDFSEEFMDYNSCTIRIENWIYNSEENATSAYDELKNGFDYHIRSEQYEWIQVDNQLYSFCVWEYSKIGEMNRVLSKVLSLEK